jgi:hypothetical protein
MYVNRSDSKSKSARKAIISVLTGKHKVFKKNSESNLTGFENNNEKSNDNHEKNNEKNNENYNKNYNKNSDEMIRHFNIIDNNESTLSAFSSSPGSVSSSSLSSKEGNFRFSSPRCNSFNISPRSSSLGNICLEKLS